MRLLADENVPGPVVAGLRVRGHDVLYAKESMAGADDPVLLALAQNDQRIVVTMDTDFGELAFRFGLPATGGVVLIRLEWKNPDEGFVEVRQRGSHVMMQKKMGETALTVPVPNHAEPKAGTFGSIIRQAGAPRNLFEAE